MDEPIVLAPGEGEVVADEPVGSSRIKAAREELLLFESAYGPDASGARPHIHRQHADAFYVLEGSLDFHVGAERRTLTAGSFVLAPPGLVHGFEIGSDGAHHLNIHAPGRDYVKLARARRDGIPFDAADGDTFSPPEDGGRPASDADVADAESDSVKADRPELALLEITFDPGSGVEPHFHKGHSDSFYVLEGEIEFHVGDEVVHATRDSYVLAPPNVVHWFRNVSDAPVRMLNLHTPGGFVQYRRELRELRDRGIEPDREFFESHDVFDV